jgi:hypothetical protein
VKKALNKLKHLFIPHANNDYKPHFFREISIGVISVVVLCLFAGSFTAHQYIKNNNLTATVLPAVLVELTNNDRQINNKNALTRSSVLDQAAELKANDMASNGYFAHTSPTGLTPWYWMGQVNYKFIYAGENLAVDFTESVDVEQAWLSSPKHRQNIMDERFTEIGIATKDAIFEGKPTTFVVQMFGKPALTVPEKTNTVVESKLAQNTVVKEVTPIDTVEKEKNGGVLGESLTNVPKVEIIKEDSSLIVAKSTEFTDLEKTNPTPSSANNSLSDVTNKDKFIFNSPKYLDLLYKIILYIVMLALILMVAIEVKRQHPKNIAYGLCLIILVLTLSYLNKSIFVSPFLI